MMAKIAKHVMPHVGVTSGGREFFQHFDKRELVSLGYTVAGRTFCVDDESAIYPIPHLSQLLILSRGRLCKIGGCLWTLTGYLRIFERK